jgi:hypothetical protein
MVSHEQFQKEFEHNVNKFAHSNRQGAKGITMQDLYDALRLTTSRFSHDTELCVDFPDHVTIIDETVVNMPSNERLLGRDFTMTIYIEGERIDLLVHMYCTDPKVLTSLSVKRVEELRANGINVTRL